MRPHSPQIAYRLCPCQECSVFRRVMTLALRSARLRRDDNTRD